MVERAQSNKQPYCDITPPCVSLEFFKTLSLTQQENLLQHQKQITEERYLFEKWDRVRKNVCSLRKELREETDENNRKDLYSDLDMLLKMKKSLSLKMLV